MIDWQARYGFRRCEPEIDRHAAATVILKSQPAPTEYTRAIGTEVDFQGWVRLAGAVVGSRFTMQLNTLAFVVIRPQRPVSAAQRAVAGRYRSWFAFERPMRSTAMTAP